MFRVTELHLLYCACITDSGVPHCSAVGIISPKRRFCLFSAVAKGGSPVYLYLMGTWFVSSEKLPRDDERVLIRQGDQIASAFYNSKTGTFNLRNGAAISKAENIKWMKIQPAESR